MDQTIDKGSNNVQVQVNTVKQPEAFEPDDPLEKEYREYTRFFEMYKIRTNRWERDALRRLIDSGMVRVDQITYAWRELVLNPDPKTRGLTVSPHRTTFLLGLLALICIAFVGIVALWTALEGRPKDWPHAVAVISIMAFIGFMTYGCLQIMRPYMIAKRLKPIVDELFPS